VNKAELILKISEEATIPKSNAGMVLASFIEAVTKTVKKEGKISVSGFGTFTKVKRKARKGRNPRTGEPLRIKASSTVRFKASKTLKTAL
jgi:DNA-binding protein HU-beta